MPSNVHASLADIPSIFFERSELERLQVACQHDGRDFYQALAAKAFEVAYPQVTRQQRQDAKLYSFVARYK